jgi:hypothetical protein
MDMDMYRHGNGQLEQEIQKELMFNANVDAVFKIMKSVLLNKFRTPAPGHPIDTVVTPWTNISVYKICRCTVRNPAPCSA